jgi:signal transduction histidine kinase
LAEAARAAYADVREGILGLRTSLGGERGFVPTLETYLEQWQGQSGVTVALATDPDPFPARLSPSGEVQLLRIIQEALANVRKHAGASHAQVRLLLDEPLLQASITDDGAGFDPDALGRTSLPRFGLATMRERAEAVGGELAISSQPGQGTTVVVRMPVVAVGSQEEIAGARADR